MAVYKDKNRGTWYASVLYVDWTGKRCRKLKRGFATKKEAQEWEIHFKLQKASSLDMTFGDFYKIYEQDIKPKEKTVSSFSLSKGIPRFLNSISRAS